MIHKMTTSFIAVICFAAWVPARNLQAAEPPLALGPLLKQAEESNPDIAASRRTWQIKRAEIGPAGAWPNPAFTFSDEDSVMGMPGTPLQKVRRYGVEQMIPFPGKLSEDARMKYHDALIARMSYRAQRLDVLREVRVRYYALYLAETRIALDGEALDVLKAVLRSTQARLAANQTPASDVFTAQTELLKMENDLLQDGRERALAQIDLNTALNRPTDAPLGEPQPPALEDAAPPLSDLKALARQNNPDYLSSLHEIRHAQAKITRSRLEYAPDFGFSYQNEQSPDRPDGRMIGLSVSIPLWITRPWGENRAAKEHLAEARALSDSLRNSVFKRLHEEWAETDTYLRMTRNDRDKIVPAALSALRAAQARYESGAEGDFLRLLEAFRGWIAAERAYRSDLCFYAQHRAELKRWVGTDSTEEKHEH